MRTATELARRLLLGPLPRHAAQDLASPALRDDVSYRLRQVGHRLVDTRAGWAALPLAAPHQQPLNAPNLVWGAHEAAMCAFLYLHLVFLAAEAGDAALEIATDLPVAELQRWCRGHDIRDTEFRSALAQLTRGSYVRRQDRMLRAGPALLALHDHELQEHCASLLLRDHMFTAGSETLDAKAD